MARRTIKPLYEVDGYLGIDPAASITGEESGSTPGQPVTSLGGGSGGVDQTARDLAATKAQGLTRTSVKTANYTAANGELVPVDASSGSVTVTLPASGAFRIAVKAVLLTSPNVVTVQCGGSDTINRSGGSTSTSLSVLGHAAVLERDASTGIVTIVSTDVPLAQQDARYPQSKTLRNEEVMTAAAYAALSVKDSATLYVLVG